MSYVHLLDPSGRPDELTFLRGEVERLNAEVAELRAQALALENLAHEDPLTSLLNRRGFTRELIRALAFVDRYATPAALLVIDLDRFKPINDRYGHAVGDQALKCLSDTLRTNVRASDTVGRLGGDEFAIVLWQVHADDAAQKAFQLEQIVSATRFLCKGHQIGLEVSVGMTPLETGDAPEAALARADLRMYLRKTERRAFTR